MIYAAGKTAVFFWCALWNKNEVYITEEHVTEIRFVNLMIMDRMLHLRSSMNQKTWDEKSLFFVFFLFQAKTPAEPECGVHLPSA